VRAPLSRLLLLALAMLAVASVMALAAPFGWPFELFSHFRPQYAVAALLAALGLAGLRQPGWALVAVVLAVWNGAPVAQRAVAAPPTATCTGAPLGVVTANLRYTNQELHRFTDWLEGHPADLVVVQELTPDWAEVLSALPGYPHKSLVARSDAYGIGVFSRWPLEGVGLLDLAGDGYPSLVGDVVPDGQRLRFYAIHARWPITPSLARSRNLALDRVAVLASTGPLPAVVTGDLNLSPDSPVFGRLLEKAGLRDALAGRRWQPTWMVGFWPLALRIDHVLVSDGVCVEHSAIGDSIGSDHRPVTVQLRLPEATASAPIAPGA
jgi:endonuclease/exonuclease/phosphatase (EEP) superfamily protein YafD